MDPSAPYAPTTMGPQMDPATYAATTMGPQMDPATYAATAVNQGPQQTIIIRPPIRFGPQPVQTICPNCQQTVVTTTVPVNGILVYLIAALIFLFCFCFSWIPLCMDSLKDIQHLCPSCNAFLGTYQKIKT